MTATSHNIFVSGASSDIGLALCDKLLNRGHRVVAQYRTQSKGLERLLGHRDVTPYQVDLKDVAALERDLYQRDDVFDSIDGFAHLAADLQPISFESATPQNLAETFNVNVFSALLITQRLIPGMIKKQFGRIVFASSIGVKFGGGADSFAYSLSKHALEFIPAASREWAAANVLFNVARIGVTDTRIHAAAPDKRMNERVATIPMGRMARPEEIALFLADLATDRNTYVCRQVLTIAGGE